MAIKFPSIRPELGEIVHPDDFNLNLKQFVDEINGNLDSDNFENPAGNGIDKGRFESGAFTENFVSQLNGVLFEGDRFQLNHNTIGYVSRDDANNVEMPVVEFDASSDGWVIVDFMASYEWKGNGFVSADEAAQKLKVSQKNFEPFFQHDTICGNPATPPGGWMGVSCSEVFKEDGTLTIEGYASESSFEGFKHKNFPQGRWIGRPIDRFAVSFKVDVNGTTISETGLLFNGLIRNGIYLTGCVPVVAGKNKIQSMVRGVSNIKLESSPRGLAGITTTGDPIGEFNPKVPDSTQRALYPLPERRFVEVNDFKGVAQGESSVSKIEIGIDCFVKTSNLVVQYRKA